MKQLSISSLLVLVLIASLVTPAFAAESQQPNGGCAPGFEIHEFGDHHDGEHMHHIGIVQDLNGDGLICVKHLPNGLHVHVDNVIR